MHKATQLTPTVTTANDGVSYIFDTTAGFNNAPGATAGPYRGRFAGCRFVMRVDCGNQAVTVRLYGRDGAGNWDLLQSTTHTASTADDYNFMPETPDWRVDILNGAAGPNSLNVTAMVVPQRTAGV